MTQSLTFMPQPQVVNLHEGVNQLPQAGIILMQADPPQLLIPAAAALEKAIWTRLKEDWEINASDAIPEGKKTVILSISPLKNAHSQYYTIEILEKQIFIKGNTPQGVFYGVQTLIQLLDQCGRELPCLTIEDWPDFPNRGIMLDISRDKIVKLETLYELIERMAGLKMNQLQLYTEHTFAYHNHPIVWAEASPYTGEDILAIDRYCRERYIELVPNQNSFGHMERWLKHPQYEDMAEVIGEFEVPWGKAHGPFSVSPAVPRTIPFITGLFDELLPHFTSRQLNIGCDETFDLGVGKSKALCEEKGTGVVYVEFLLKLYEDLKRRGFTTQFWGDIILRHPELVPHLPKDMIALEWGYEADHPFAEHSRIFADSGIPFYVCPGTSSWNTLAGRTENTIGNLRSAAKHGKANGAVGYLITDWGDNGHWQTAPISWLGYGYGAAYGWSGELNTPESLRVGLSRFLFEDPTGVAGSLFHELGNVYLKTGVIFHNQTLMNALFNLSPQDITADQRITAEGIQSALNEVERIKTELLPQERIGRPDAETVRAEVALTIRMVEHGLQRGLAALGMPAPEHQVQLAEDLRGIMDEYKRIWLIRNRPGGLEDSMRRFRELLEMYQAA